MSYLNYIRDKLGNDIYWKLEEQADIEVGLAMKMELLYDDRKDNYYNSRFLLPELLQEYKTMIEIWLTISPQDIVNILFKCKLFKIANQSEYRQRNWWWSYVDEIRFCISNNEKDKKLDDLIIKYFDRQKEFLSDKILITRLDGLANTSNASKFLDKLFENDFLPFTSFIHVDWLNEKYFDISEKDYDDPYKKIDEYFQSPSIWCHVSWSSLHCHYMWSVYMRTLLQLIKISWYINCWQIEFGRDIRINAPIWSVFLWTGTSWCYSRNEDKKEPWLRIPDGWMRRSYWFRWTSPLWLDDRNFDKIDTFFKENKVVREYIINPWNDTYLDDISPILDILCSATQIQDVWAKILLLYCSLEHLFVPSWMNRDNKKYIVWWINTLNRNLLPWFDKLYWLRCDYAHKWYIRNHDAIISTIIESFKNIIWLLRSKISISK